MNYREASEHFVNTAFCLLDTYKHAPNSIDPNKAAYLDGDYGLRIDKFGRLNVVDPNGKVIAHTFNETWSQITYIGRLLAVYLEHLQRDYC